jgi:hypothetical protein
MIILIGCAVALVAGLLWLRHDDMSGVAFGLTSIGGLGLFLGLLFLLVGRLEVRGFMTEVESVRTSIAAARVNGENIENAALQVKVAEVNATLARAQYWNGTVFDLWYPDAIEAVEPVR